MYTGAQGRTGVGLRRSQFKYKRLRIDNSWQDMICTTLLSSAAILSIVSYYTSSEINYVGVTSDFMKLLILNLFFHFYFLNMVLAEYLYPCDNILHRCS